MAITKLIEIAETIADNKFILGDRLVEVGISGPNLEATLSSIAMAQAELGHARLIYRWAFDLKGINSSKVDIKNQTGKAFSNAVEVDNWISLIAALYTVSVAAELVITAILEADHPQISPPFSKMLKEQNEHLVYSKIWCEQLLIEKGSIPGRFRTALDKASREAKKWLETIENDKLLITENIIIENTNLTKKFNHTLKELIADGVAANA
ncbi:phenylacetic acid catabolism protein [Cytobacillus depressus]|uniref:Phenylacetic acid catabolism protein n=1 Tax=Cytobacillus depressus TaxID=1602942 RepID=A0A6L3V2L6_9BACI|nr:Phenylacetic acid catabolic protein [Cytobacillus depressus]KAB2330493.1 phenylacetic acid catabolism protein [Cytobacillus depressus]